MNATPVASTGAQTDTYAAPRGVKFAITCVLERDHARHHPAGQRELSK